MAHLLLGRSEGNEAGDTSSFCQLALTLPKGVGVVYRRPRLHAADRWPRSCALSFLKKAKILIFTVYDENVTSIQLILANGDFVRFPIQFRVGASRLASLFGVLGTRPEDKPDATYQDCQ